MASNTAFTCTLAPLISLISLILLPPLPMREPHWDAGTISFRDNPSFFSLLVLVLLLPSSSSILSQIRA